MVIICVVFWFFVVVVVVVVGVFHLEKVVIGGVFVGESVSFMHQF